MLCKDALANMHENSVRYHKQQNDMVHTVWLFKLFSQSWKMLVDVAQCAVPIQFPITVTKWPKHVCTSCELNEDMCCHALACPAQG